MMIVTKTVKKLWWLQPSWLAVWSHLRSIIL